MFLLQAAGGSPGKFLTRMDRDQARELAGFWASRGFAIAWTQSKDGDGAKRVTTKGWPDKAELYADDDNSAGLIAGRIERKNPCVVARKSGLILVDCDSEADTSAFKAFHPPPTLAATTGKGRHFYYRPDEGCDEFRGIYFEAGAVTPKGDCYLVTPPALHPSGRHYEWDNDFEIAVLPADVYRAMLAAGGVNERGHKQHEALPEGEKLAAGARHKYLESLAGRLRRDGVPMGDAFYLLMSANHANCDPPKTAKEIKHLVDSTWGKYEAELPGASGPAAANAGRSPEGARPPTDYSGSYIRVSDAQSRHVPWLDKPYLQQAAFQVLAAKGSTGKGLWTAQLASLMSHGVLPGQDGVASNIAFISSEDNVSQDVKPRLQAADADVERCFVVTQQFLLPRDTEWLEGLIEHLSLGLVVIDPVANHIGGVDGNDESAIREALAQLNRVADEHNCLVLGVRHMRKDAESGAIAAVLGSTAWTDLPRNVIVMVRDPDDPAVVHQDVLKQNRAAMGDTGRVYRIEGVDITLDDGIEDNVGLMSRALDVEFKDLDSIVGKKKGPSLRKQVSECLVATLKMAPGSAMLVAELDIKVAADTNAALGTVRNVRTGMTVPHDGTATESMPLQSIKRENVDQPYRVKLAWGTGGDLPGIPGV